MSTPCRRPRSLAVSETIDAPLLSSHNHLVLTSDGLLVAAGDQAQIAVDLASHRRRWVVDLRDETAAEPCPFFAVAELRYQPRVLVTSADVLDANTFLLANDGFAASHGGSGPPSPGTPGASRRAARRG